MVTSGSASAEQLRPDAIFMQHRPVPVAVDVGEAGIAQWGKVGHVRQAW